MLHTSEYDTLAGPGWGLQLRASGIAGKYRRIENPGVVDLSPRANAEDDTEAFSPPLWKTSPSKSPRYGALNIEQQHRDPPSSARAEAIAAGRKELLEMLKGLPESAYELSLQDLVELPMKKGDPLASRRVLEEEKKKTLRKESSETSNDSRKGAKNVPFLLKMFIPSVLVTNKKIPGTGTGAKVSPKPSQALVEGEKAGFDWELQRRSPPAAEEESRNGRSSSSGKNRNKGGFSLGCFSFFAIIRRNDKDGKHKGRH